MRVGILRFPVRNACRQFRRALLAGFTVALIEETFFRGAMFSALARQGHWITAAVLTSMLYSLVHFVGEKVRIAPEDVNLASGWVILQRYFSAFADPARIGDAALALFLVGMLLALIRRLTGHIGGCIGLHAGFVAVIALFREVTTPMFDGTWSFLVSRFDGLVGYLVAVAAALCCAATRPSVLAAAAQVRAAVDLAIMPATRRSPSGENPALGPDRRRRNPPGNAQAPERQARRRALESGCPSPPMRAG